MCVWKERQVERSSDVEVIVSQISGGDGVSMCVVGVEERDKEGGREGRRGDEGWCVPAGCVMEGRSKLAPSSPSLFSLSSDSHAICMEL